MNHTSKLLLLIALMLGNLGRISATSLGQIQNHLDAGAPQGAGSQTHIYLPLMLSGACPPIQRGLAFLDARYNPAIGLLNESPVVAPNRYWLTNDNALAAYVFARLGKPAMSGTLRASMRRYGYDSNGFIDVAWGVPVAWPPSVERQVMLLKSGTDEIWQEFHDTDIRFLDWREYANLGFLGALNEHSQGRTAQAHEVFAATLSQFNGIGFRDKAYRTHYETYKLALALYAGATIHAPIPSGDELLTALLGMQGADGGFVTLYRDLQTPEGDANTETTSLALLALDPYGCKRTAAYRVSNGKKSWFAGVSAEPGDVPPEPF